MRESDWTAIYCLVLLFITIVVVGILIANKMDKKRNLRATRLYEKRIVIFEKTKRKIYDEELYFINDNAFLRKKEMSTGTR